MTFFTAREAETSLACPDCGEALHIARTCHEAYMRCPACEARFPLREYIARADAVMEAFLERLHCDRI